VEDHGITSFKHFIAYKGALMLEDDGLLNSYTAARDLGAIVTNHCEHGELVTWGQKKMKQLGIFGPEGHPQSRPPEDSNIQNRHVRR
jgi:dihydropyrimidinase